MFCFIHGFRPDMESVRSQILSSIEVSMMRDVYTRVLRVIHVSPAIAQTPFSASSPTISTSDISSTLKSMSTGGHVD